MFRAIIVLLVIISVAQSVSAESPGPGRAIEPNVMFPPGESTTSLSSDMVKNKSMLTFCAQPLTQWPEDLQNACKTFLLSAVTAERRSIQQRLEHTTFSSEHLQRSLASQAWQSVLLFWTVIAITALGTAAAVTQFYRSLTTPDLGSADLIITMNEFRIKTTWLGALLLAMSMGFLALYLVFVYPVQPLGPG